MGDNRAPVCDSRCGVGAAGEPDRRGLLRLLAAESASRVRARVPLDACPSARPGLLFVNDATIIESIERAQLRKVPRFKAGDTVRVHFQVIEGARRRVQVYEGIVIKRQGSGARETFTVRKQSFGVGVERTFPLHSPKIEKIEVTAIGDVNRAKLYYLRGRVGKKARVREKRYGPGSQAEKGVEPKLEAPDEEHGTLHLGRAVTGGAGMVPGARSKGDSTTEPPRTVVDRRGPCHRRRAFLGQGGARPDAPRACTAPAGRVGRTQNFPPVRSRPAMKSVSKNEEIYFLSGKRTPFGTYRRRAQGPQRHRPRGRVGEGGARAGEGRPRGRPARRHTAT